MPLSDSFSVIGTFGFDMRKDEILSCGSGLNMGVRWFIRAFDSMRICTLEFYMEFYTWMVL